MANILLAWKNKADNGTLSSGSWQASLPLTNLQSTKLSKKARSTDATLANTKFDIDLGAVQPVQNVSIVSTNFTTDALVRVRGSSDNTFATSEYDSGWIDAFPSLYTPGTLLWGVDPVWTGKPAQEDVDRYTKNFIHILPSMQILRYWRIELDDTANADGFVDIGRLFIGPTWTPSRNYSHGSQFTYESLTQVDRTVSGAHVFDQRDPLRAFTFELGFLSDQEANETINELRKDLDTYGEIIVAPDYEDTTNHFREAFLGRLKRQDPLLAYANNLRRTSFTVEELN